MIAACRGHDARFSLTVRNSRPVRDAIDAIDDDDAVDLDAFHRRHAVCELAIRDLKAEGLAQHPSGVFSANAAWLVLAALAHNLLRWTAKLGDLADGAIVAKTLRRRMLAVPGILVRTGRRHTLRLPSRWPWRGAFLAALNRLRALPAAAPG